MDMMTKIANLIAETMNAVWPEAEGLPNAEELEQIMKDLEERKEAAINE